MPKKHIRRVLSPSALLLLAALTATGAAAADLSDIVVEVTTDQAVYEPGEPIQIVVQECNPTDEVIEFTFGCPSCGRLLRIFDPQGDEIVLCGGGGILVPETITWQPGECLTVWTPTWNQGASSCSLGQQVPDGRYALQFFWDLNAPFDTLPPSEPTFVVIGRGAVVVPALSGLGVWALAAALSVAAILWLRRTARGDLG